MALPQFDKNGNLPPGIHACTWDEFRTCFGVNRQRRDLLRGLLAALRNFKTANVTDVWIDGSFVTSNPFPNDWDGLYSAVGADVDKLDPVFRDLADLQNGRPKQKRKFKGEFLFSAMSAGRGQSMLDYFQQDDRLGVAVPKGIVEIDMGSLP